MKFKNFTRTATLVGAISATAMLTGCGKVIDEGNFGIEKYIGGKYNTEVLEQGWKPNVFDTIYEVYGRENLIKIDDSKPKDLDGAMLEDLDLSISVRTLKGGAIKFILSRGDIYFDKDKDAYVIGINYIKKDAQSVLSESAGKFTSETILKNRNAFEEMFKKDLQAELNKLYGEVFLVEEVKVSNIKVSKPVEEKIQFVTVIKAEQDKNDASMKILASREALMTQEATLLKRASEKSGVSVESILQNEMIKAIRENNTSIQVTVPAVKPKM